MSTYLHPHLLPDNEKEQLFDYDTEELIEEAYHQAIEDMGCIDGCDSCIIEPICDHLS